jgi:beta-galactosidase/beta-glucuronidase
MPACLAQCLTWHRLQGGFIWDWVDQALLKEEPQPDGSTLQYWAYGGDYGDSPNDAQVLGRCRRRLAGCGCG